MAKETYYHTYCSLVVKTLVVQTLVVKTLVVKTLLVKRPTIIPIAAWTLVKAVRKPLVALLKVHGEDDRLAPRQRLRVLCRG